MTPLLLYIFLFAIGFFLLAFYLLNPKNSILYKSRYAVAHVTDNLGKDHYKIVGKRKGHGKRYMELEDFNVINSGHCSKTILDYARSSWETREEAEKALEMFKIHVGQTPYTKNIELT